MKKLLFLFMLGGTYMFASMYSDDVLIQNQTNDKSDYWLEESFEDPLKSDAGRRRGKGKRGRRRGGSGLR